jgi:anti-anti-sigma regulatory factor
MPYSIVKTETGFVLRLAGVVTTRHVSKLADDLAPELSASTVDANVETKDLEDTDTCILQLLCSLRKSVSSLSFDDPSEVFIAALDRCGLRRELLGARDCL